MLIWKIRQSNADIKDAEYTERILNHERSGTRSRQEPEITPESRGTSCWEAYAARGRQKRSRQQTIEALASLPEAEYTECMKTEEAGKYLYGMYDF